MLVNMDTPSLSVIIPTFNRKDSLLRTLDNLNLQSIPDGSFEVIVVDDGSIDDSESVRDIEWLYSLQYVRQENRGAHYARNEGAKISRAPVIIFIDDDVTIQQDALYELRRFCLSNPQSIVIGKVFQRCDGEETIFSRNEMHQQNSRLSNENESVSPPECNTQFLAVRRDDFFEIGMMRDPIGRRPTWDDVELGYRAHLLGFSIMRCASAVAEHWDYVISDLHTASNRWRAASRGAVRLFQVHPGLVKMLPMFRDKTPVSWKEDPVPLILRKRFRHIATSKPIMTALVSLVTFLERSSAFVVILRPLYRWIIGGSIYRGFQEGLIEFGLLNDEDRLNGRYALKRD